MIRTEITWGNKCKNKKLKMPQQIITTILCKIKPKNILDSD